MSKCNKCDQPIVTTDETYSLCKPCKKLSERTSPIQITPMEVDDLELVLAWRSNPKIYHHFHKQDSPLDWDAHLSWYESPDQHHHNYVINYKFRRVGAVSVRSDNSISIYIGDFSARGQGVAKATLGWMCERFADRTPLFAEIHDENIPSKQLFENCGFEQCGQRNEWKQYEYVADT